MGGSRQGAGACAPYVRPGKDGGARPPARPAGPMAMPVACMVQQQRQGVRNERGNQLPGRWDEGQAMALFKKKILHV